MFPASEHQGDVMALIRQVKSKSYTAESLAKYNAAAADLEARGAECLILACTELSGIADSLTADLPVYDTSQLLAEHIVREVKGQIKQCPTP